MNITLSQLQYILAVDQYRHFQTAADQSYVTQPTLSMQIKKLEEVLGVIIFDRSRHPVQPTPLGEIIIEHARETINAAKKINEILEEDYGDPVGSLVIGVIPTIGPYLVPQLMAALTEKYEVEFRFEEMLTGTMVEKIRAGSLDAGIVSTPLNEKGIDEIMLYYEPLWIYASEGHPVLQHDMVSPESLSTDSLWLLTDGHCFRDHVLRLCRKNTPALFNKFQYTTGSLEALTRIIDMQFGYTLLPHLATLDMNTEKKRSLRKFAAPVPKREVSIIVRQGFLKRRLINLMREEIVNNLQPGLILETEDAVLKWKD
jgi:LysR family transcriptional regulator, hydrogen peroxide-inducible genes activator